jgi:hypothetical protein
MSHAAAALYIHPPIFETTVAVQMTAYVRCRNGRSAEALSLGVTFATEGLTSVQGRAAGGCRRFHGDYAPAGIARESGGGSAFSLRAGQSPTVVLGLVFRAQGREKGLEGAGR